MSIKVFTRYDKLNSIFISIISRFYFRFAFYRTLLSVVQISSIKIFELYLDKYKVLV